MSQIVQDVQLALASRRSQDPLPRLSKPSHDRALERCFWVKVTEGKWGGRKKSEIFCLELMLKCIKIISPSCLGHAISF